MIAPPERSAERDAVIGAMLPRVPAQGWTRAALRTALADLGGDAEDADLLFPGGPIDAVEAFIDLTDRRMEEAALAPDFAEMRLPRRVRTLIAHRFALSRPHKEAIRRALAALARPRHAAVAARCTARSVDAIWFAAGDRSADFSWYTKRASLAAIYSATLLFWLRDYSEDDSATLDFLDRRLKGIGRVAKLRRRIEDRCAQFWPRRRAA